MESYQEKADTLCARFGISPIDAMRALEECDGDIIDAVVRLEAEGIIIRTSAVYRTGSSSSPHDGIKLNEEKTSQKKGFGGKIKNLLSEGMLTAVIISKDDRQIIRIPVLILIILFLMNIHSMSIIAVGILLWGCKFGIEKSEDTKSSVKAEKAAG